MDENSMNEVREVYASSSNGELTDTQIRQWRTEGYTFVGGLIPDDLISDLRAAAVKKYPEPGSSEAERIRDFGSFGAFNFPSQTVALNQLTLHSNLLQAVSDLLGTEVNDLRLTQSDLWPKYGRVSKSSEQDNQDQRIHIDYPNHTLAHPAPWDKPEAVEMVVYFDHVGDTGGGTAIVPRQGLDDPAYRWPIVDSPGIGNLRYINDRCSAEAYFSEQKPELADWRRSLYERECHVAFKPGDILFYRHDTWHRGTPLLPGSRRIVQNLTFRRAFAEWISTLHVGWSWSAYRDNKYLEKLIATASLDQRAVLGFPQPGSQYWCEATLSAIEARYGVFGMDMTPYREGMV